MPNTFELFLFSTDPQVIRTADSAGVHGFIVDMENKGKQTRQTGYDTQINLNTIEDLKNARSSTDREVICRINGFGEHTPAEVEQVISAGVDEILLPMVRHSKEVTHTLDFIHNRCKLGILIETAEAVKAASTLGSLPLSRVYVGLNDLAIDRKTRCIFTSVADGTLEHIRSSIQQHFGFGGLTLPEKGHPIPCRLLAGEITRLGCDFTFLRRSFFKDIAGHEMKVEIPRILEFISECRARSNAQVEKDHAEFADLVNTLERSS
jgi:citrate lyase beta subunit